MARHISGQYEAELDAARRLLMEMADRGEHRSCDEPLANLRRHQAELIQHLEAFLSEYESEESCAS